MSTQHFAGRLELDLTALQASQEPCGHTSVCQTPENQPKWEKKNVCENSDTSEQVCASLQKWPVDIKDSSFQETSVGF